MEGQPRAVHPQLLPRIPFADGFTDEGIEKGLGDALDAEALQGCSSFKQLAAAGRHGDGEAGWIGGREGRDVGSHPALPHGLEAPMGLYHQFSHHGLAG